eukprot:m.829764 g.829764  ORF g.829764 m.829764 type:complete len:193 (+) comp59448_c0_seq35:144-722(+)
MEWLQQCMLRSSRSDRRPQFPVLKELSVLQTLATTLADIHPLPTDNATTQAHFAQAIVTLSEAGVTRADVEGLPCALRLIMQHVLHAAKAAPSASWPPAAFLLVSREDYYALITNSSRSNFRHSPSPSLPAPQCSPGNLAACRFPLDLRLAEVERLLSSSTPRSIRVSQVVPFFQLLDKFTLFFFRFFRLFS